MLYKSKTGRIRATSEEEKTVNCAKLVRSGDKSSNMPNYAEGVNTEQTAGIAEHTSESEICMNATSKVLESPQVYKDTSHKEDQLEEMPVIDMQHFKMVGENDKLDLLMAAINKINTNFYYKMEDIRTRLLGETDGVITKLDNIQSKIEKLERDAEVDEARIENLESFIPNMKSMEKRIIQLEQQNCEFRDEIAVLRGFTQVHDKAILSHSTKIADLTQRSMSNNITIQGILGDSKDENCKEKVLTFMRDCMKCQWKKMR